MLAEAGFVDVVLNPQPESKEYIKHWLPGLNADEYVVAANITATRPPALQQAAQPQPCNL